jgi:hypothetical protein
MSKLYITHQTTPSAMRYKDAQRAAGYANRHAVHDVVMPSRTAMVPKLDQYTSIRYAYSGTLPCPLCAISRSQDPSGSMLCLSQTST